ncbi:MAG: PAS domain S-box protein, partial [Puniceicoccales bacterium]
MKPHSIRLALILAFTCVIVFVVTMGGLSAWKGAKAEILIEHLYECSLEEEYWSDAMFLSAMALRSGILHPEDGGSIDDEFQEFLHALSRSIEANQNSLRFVVELDEQERIDAAETEVKELLSFYRVVQELAADWRDSVSGAAEMEYREQFLTAFDEQIFPRLKAYQENARSSLSREGDEILELVSGFWRTVLVVGVLCIGISIMAGYFLYCRVIGPIRRMAEEVEKVAADNFSDRVEKTGVLEIDRMGSAFNAVMDSLHKANLTGAEMKDLAERRRDELGRVLELVPDIVCAVDSLGGVVEVNRGFEMVLGYSREEILGKNIFDLVHPDDKRRSEAERDIMLVEGRLSVLFENRLKHRDGTWRTISWSSSPSLEDQTVYAVGRDITEMVEVRAEQGRSFQRALQGQQSLMELRDSIRMEKRQ